jgi:hypothetical protein
MDLPVGFTDSGSLLLYFQVGPSYSAFGSVYAITGVSRHNALVVASGVDPALAPDPGAVLYANVSYAPSAWYCFEQLQVGPPAVTPLVQPMLSTAECAAEGLTWVAIALGTPDWAPPPKWATPSAWPGPTCLSCSFLFPGLVNTSGATIMTYL